MTNLENKLTNIAYYFEGIQPISETDIYLKSKKYNL